MNIRKIIIKLTGYIIIYLFWILIVYSLTKLLFSPMHPKYKYTYKEYVVSNGDRLWNIAKNELKNNLYYKDNDVRQIVYEIQKDNNINSIIYEGQTLKIRIKKDELSIASDQTADR